MEENKKVNNILNGLLILQLIIAVLSIFTGLNALGRYNLTAYLSFAIAGIALIGGITLRMKIGIGYYLTSFLGLIVIGGNLYTYFTSQRADWISVVLGFFLLMTFFNKKIKEAVL